MGKGSAPRPCSVDAQTFASNWNAIFNRGVAERSKASGSNPDNGRRLLNAPHTVGSNPTAPAIYVDDATGAWVDEAWWPGDPV